MKTPLQILFARPGDWVFLLLLLPTGYLGAEHIGVAWWVYLLDALALGWLINLLTLRIREREAQTHLSPEAQRVIADIERALDRIESQIEGRWVP